MNSQKWFALLALLLQNMPALQMIFQNDKKEGEINNAPTSDQQKN